MRILYICAYKKNIVGGVPSVVPKYLEHMSECADVYVFSYRRLEFENEKKKICQIKSKKVLLKSLKNMDIVVFHEVYYLSYYNLAEKLYKNNIPYIVIPHCSLTRGAQEQKKWLKKIINVVWVKKFIRQALRVQYLSMYERNSSKMFEAVPIIIPNGIRPVDGIMKEYLEHDSIEIVFIGRYSIKQKGLDLLMDACALIKDEMMTKKININFYGTDFEGGKAYIQDRIKMYGFDGNIRLHGPVYGEDKQNVLLRSDVYILTSRYEGLPMGILEAMRIGLPVFVTFGSGFGEIVHEEKCGWSVEENIVAISEGILQIAKEKDRLPFMSERAANVVKKYYVWDKVAIDTKKEYEKALRGRNSDSK